MVACLLQQRVTWLYGPAALVHSLPSLPACLPCSMARPPSQGQRAERGYQNSSRTASRPTQYRHWSCEQQDYCCAFASLSDMSGGTPPVHLRSMLQQKPLAVLWRALLGAGGASRLADCETAVYLPRQWGQTGEQCRSWALCLSTCLRGFSIAPGVAFRAERSMGGFEAGTVTTLGRTLN